SGRDVFDGPGRGGGRSRAGVLGGGADEEGERVVAAFVQVGSGGGDGHQGERARRTRLVVGGGAEGAGERGAEWGGEGVSAAFLVGEEGGPHRALVRC